MDILTGSVGVSKVAISCVIVWGDDVVWSPDGAAEEVSLVP